MNNIPNKPLRLSDKILSSMGNDSSMIADYSQAFEVLDTIASNHPDDVWEQMIKYISLPYDERGFAIINWMRGGPIHPSNSILEKVAFEKILDWIDHDPHKLAPYIAGHCKPELSPSSLARKLLVKYGSEVSVQRSLVANFSTEGILGSASTHFKQKKEKLLTYKEQDDDINVKNWIDFYSKIIDEDIKREQLREEREF